MRNYIFILLISLIPFKKNLAKDELFKKANNLYAKENFKDATLIYDSILQLGYESNELYYNLGNCYYKENNWSEAIWHYEKSLKLKYNESTIQNLQLAKLRITDHIEPLPELFYIKWRKKITNIYTTLTWQLLSICMAWTLLLIYIINKYFNFRKNLFKPILLFSIILYIISYNAYIDNVTKKEAIIFSTSITVNSAPSINSTELFLLHSGVKIEIIDEIGEWINIRTSNGNKGWIKTNNCKAL